MNIHGAQEDPATDLASVLRHFFGIRLKSNTPKRITLGRTTFMDAPFVWARNRGRQKGKGNWTNNKAYSKPTLGFVEGY